MPGRGIGPARGNGKQDVFSAMSVTRRMISGVLLTLLAAGLPAWSVSADEADDQYAVAAGHYAAQRWQLATEEFQAFLDKYPDHSRRKQGVFFLAEALLQLGKHAEARKSFQQCLQLAPDDRVDRPALFRTGEAAYLDNQYDLAKVDLQRFREKHPADPLNAFVLPYLGEIALSQKDFAAAEGHFREGLRAFPEGKLQDDCRFGLARALERQGKQEEAERLYLALAGKTGSRLAEDAQFRLGAVRYARGNYAEAVEAFAAFDSRLAGSPHRATALLGSGWALVKLDRLADARKYFEKITSDPKVGTEAKYWLGWIQKTQNQWDVASKTLLDALEADPKHKLAPAIRFHAGDALLRAGKSDAALAQFDQVAATAPADDPWIDDALRGKVQAALLMKDHAALDRYVEEFTAKSPKSDLAADVQRFRAQSLLERKQYQLAADLLQPLVKSTGPVNRDSDRGHPATNEPVNRDSARGQQSIGKTVIRDSARGQQSTEEHYLLALAYEGLNRYDDALSTLAPVLESSDLRLRSDAQLAQASMLLAGRRFAEAVAPLESFLASRPKGDAAAKGLGQLAICYARTGQIDRAKKLYVQMIADYPQHELLAPTTEQLAEAAYDAEEKEWADKLFGWLAADGQPQDYQRKGLSGLAWSQFKAGKLEEAAATFERLLATNPEPAMAAEASLARGQILRQLGQLDAALAMLDVVIQKYPQTDRCADALWDAAQIRDQRNEDRQAAELYQRLADGFPQFSQIDAVLYNWAWALTELGQADEAAAVFARLVKDHPASAYWADANLRVAQRAMEVKDYARARQAAGEILDGKAPDHLRENALYLVGQIAAAEKKWPEAESSFARLLKEYPQGTLRGFAEYGLAEAVFWQGRYDAARQRFQELVTQAEGRRQPWAAVAQLRLAQALCQEKKWNEAYEAASKIEAAHPGFPEQYEADYVIGYCLARRADFEGARQAYRKVLRSPNGEKTETAAKAQLMIAESHFHQQDYAAALREYLRLEILYAYPALQAAAVMQAAECHELLGEWKEAGELYQRLLQNYSNSEFAAKAKQRLETARRHVAKPAS